MAERRALAGDRGCVDRVRAALEGLLEARTYDKGSLLFEQGQRPASVFFLRSGSVHLERAGFKTGSDLCVAKPGDVIGVTYAISGRNYDMSAVVKAASSVEVVDREAFLDSMTASSGMHLEVVQMLSIDLGRCYEVLRTLGPKTRNRRAEQSTL